MSIEIEVNALAAKPLGQIAPENLADLFALAEMDGLPPALQVRLRGYPERMARAIRDLPNGPSYAAYVEAVGEVPGDRVPHTLRAALHDDAQRTSRTDRDREAVAAVEATWADVEPVAFTMGEAKAIQQVPAPRTREKKASTRRSSSADSDDATAESTASTGPKQTRIVQAMDDEKIVWVKQVVMERLARNLESGLKQDVILAAVRHRARDRFSTLTPKEVVEVLKLMETEGHVKHSAGRWRALIRRYGR